MCPHVLAFFALQVTDGSFDFKTLTCDDKASTCNVVSLGFCGGTCSFLSNWHIYLHELISSTCASYKKGECIPMLTFYVKIEFMKKYNFDHDYKNHDEMVTKKQTSREAFSCQLCCYDTKSADYHENVANDLHKIQRQAKHVREYKKLLKKNITDKSFVKN